jgi:hypothetical protein
MFPSAIDSSILATYKSCPKLFYLNTIQGWKSKDPSVHLRAGAAFARGIEVAREKYYVEGVAADQAQAFGLGALLQSYGDFECPPDSPKSAERTAGALEFYFEHYPLNEDSPPITLPSGKRGIEFNFVHPLPIDHPETGDPLVYCGRMDAILNYAGGVYICDEKTASSLGPTWSRQWDLRSQFSGYAWGCREAGIRVDGVIVRGVSILKTKYDTQEAISYRPDWQVDRWYEEMLEWVEDMVAAYRKGKWRHNLDHACGDFGGCGFRQVCASQDESPWLTTYFEQRDWDPIMRKETLR